MSGLSKTIRQDRLALWLNVEPGRMLPVLARLGMGLLIFFLVFFPE